MKRLLSTLGLYLLLLFAQQGAVVHELGHFSTVDPAQCGAVTSLADSACGLCPSFAQVATAAFSHSFRLPSLVLASAFVTAAPPVVVLDAAVPIPRSRGPPV